MDASIFQTEEWEDFKLKTGYEKSYRLDDILILQRQLPFSMTFLYSPMVDSAKIQKIGRGFIEEVKNIAERNKSIFYRLELNIPKENEAKLKILNTKFSFVKAFEEMQPEHNWVLNINKPIEQLLAEMKQKGRYNIKIAEKNKIEIISSDKPGKELDAFYDQYSKTGQRHKISYRNKRYFEALLEIMRQKSYARVYVARAKNSDLASAIILYSETAALYLYGGSNDNYRNLMAPYLLHWKIIKEAREQGYKEYNFLGIAPDDNPAHPWAGITRFKKQFGGEQVDIAGSYDLPIKPMQYQMFKAAEKIRRH